MAKPVKKGLGKGLGALLGDQTQSFPQINNVAQRVGVTEIDLAKISANPNQPRKNFEEESLKELANSIEQLGVITPITVRKMGVDSYQIISGERRFRASQLAGKAKIPAYVRDVDDDQAFVMGMVENLQREDLDPIEIAQGYQRMIEEGNLTQEQVGAQVSKNHSTIANSLRLLTLPPEIQLGLSNRDISVGQAKAIISIEDEDKQKEIYTLIIEKDLSVREVEELVRRYKNASQPSPKPTKTDEQRAIQTKIAEKLNAKVSLNVTSKGNGKIAISFENQDELNAIVSLLEKI